MNNFNNRKIDAAQLKKQVQAFKKGKKNTPKKGSKSALNQSVATDPGEEEDLNLGRDELVDLANIEMVHKKRRHDKEARLKVSSLTQLFLYFFSNFCANFEWFNLGAG